MDIPREQERGDGDVSFSRMGSCQKCGMIKMSIGGIKKCPSCDTKSTTRSGLVNKIKSVPESAFKKVKRKGLDGKEYEEFVPKSKMEMAKEVSKQIDSTPNVTVDTSGVLNKRGGFEKLANEAAYSVSPLDALDGVIDYFESQPAKDINEFKRIDKLRKAVKKLRTQVEEYIGGSK